MLRALVGALLSLALSVGAVGCNGVLVDDDSLSKGASASSAPVANAAYAERCNAARGVGDPVEKKGDVNTKLEGRWFFCPGEGKEKQVPLSRDEGMELSADGKWWFLQSDGSGGFMRKPGVENAGTWDQDWARDDQANLIYLRFWNNSFMWLSLGFETSPRRWLGTYYAEPALHAVPID